jgi:hypothetical protein
MVFASLRVKSVRMFTSLTSFIPSPSKERGKRFIERGETPLLPSCPLRAERLE